MVLVILVKMIVYIEMWVFGFGKEGVSFCILLFYNSGGSGSLTRIGNLSRREW